MRWFNWIVIIATVLALAAPVRVLAAGGSILYLLAWGGYAPDTTVTIQTNVQAANKKISGSNLYYTITGPGSDPTLRTSHSTSLSTLDPYQTFLDQWDTTNTGWPAGTYTITLCWSTGNSHNCDIASATTSLSSVPTLGWLLGAAGLGMLFFFLWRRRNDFAISGKAGTA